MFVSYSNMISIQTNLTLSNMMIKVDRTSRKASLSIAIRKFTLPRTYMET